MAFRSRFLGTAALVATLAVAPAVHAERWHGGYHQHGGGGAAGAAIIGGILGLGVGAAIASVGRLLRRAGILRPRLLRSTIQLLRAAFGLLHAGASARLLRILIASDLVSGVTK